MPRNLGRIGLPSTPNPANVPRAQTQQGIILWAVVGALLLSVIFGVVIKMRRDE